jgi:hypothetical protein
MDRINLHLEYGGVIPYFSCWHSIKHLLGADCITWVDARNMARTSTTATSFELAMVEASSSAVEVEVMLGLELHEKEGRACGGAVGHGLPPMWLGCSPLANTYVPASTQPSCSRGTTMCGQVGAAAMGPVRIRIGLGDWHITVTYTGGGSSCTSRISLFLFPAKPESSSLEAVAGTATAAHGVTTETKRKVGE